MVKIDIFNKYLKKHSLFVITALICVSLEAVCDLLQPTIMARIIDDGIKNSSLDAVIKYGFIMLAVSLAGMAFAGTRNVLASIVSQRFGQELRFDSFEKVLNFSEQSADSLESGSIITRLTNDTSQIVQFANGMMRIFFKAPLTCIGAIVLATMLNLKLSIIMFIGIILVAAFIVISMKLSYIRFNKVQYAIDRVNTVVQEYLSGIRLVKSFGRYSHEEEQFDKVNEDLAQKSIKSQLVIVYFSPLMSLAINLSILGIFYAGSIMFQRNTVEVGKIVAFISYMSQILFSLIMITNIFNTFVRTKASANRVNEILNSEEEIIKGSRCENQNSDSQLEFQNVTFAYPMGSGIPAIKDVSFSIKQGETMAIIGPTGSGKSTIAWLLLRFYNADKGKIFFNGEDICGTELDKLREQISVAPQKSMLFSGTVFQNILYGNPNASQAQVHNAAETACAGFINEMPDRYESILGQGGVNISGGQKQRISIARAVIKNAPVLILDDCTSALDAVTEAKIRARLKNLPNTVIIITQRIGTAMTADKILVMENGKAVGFGSHSDLFENCQTYRDIFFSQIGQTDFAY